tara:strand:- start:328 stop:729 length:402 start_codon:yes stop_codon:yes gene_type:complete
MSKWKYVDPSDLDLQGLFDASVNHVLEQGIPSIDTVKRTCLYRHPEGLQCAASIFISDEEYKTTMEHCPFTLHMVNCELQDSEIKLIRLLQRAHDDAATDAIFDMINSDFLTNYKKYVVGVAKKFHLEYSHLF